MKRFFESVKQYPSAVVGLLLVLLLVVISIYTIITIPYDQAIREWRGGDDVRADVPRTARPIYFNWFSAQDLPPTLVFDTADPVAGVEKSVVELGNLWDINMVIEFDYEYDDFPKELQVILTSQFEDKAPFITLTWYQPDGTQIKLADIVARPRENFRFQDEKLRRTLQGVPPEIALFSVTETEPRQVQKGTYELHIDAIVFEEDADVDARLISFGQVHGIAGTDHRRRDLSLALLWGAPIALAFGLLAALGTTITTMFIAAVGVWFGGWVDEVIQRITEINMLLPFLPILIMIGIFYSRSIWAMLGAVIALSIFGAAIKSYRAIFLQVKESSYIEAARSYGAGNWRIINRYLIPRIIPVLIPGLVSSIPAFVFLEASLAVLGLGDPILPTWGKVINDAQVNGALFNANYYWILQPAVLLMITGLGFAMIGFALDRIFNPKLREV